MKLSQVLRFSLLALLSSAASLRAQNAEVDAWCNVLLESPHLLADDRDARAAELLELIERSPEHPLVEFALRILRTYETDRPGPYVDRCLALDPSRMTPSSRAELAALRIECEKRRASVDGEPPADLGADRLTPTLAIGPLPDVYDAARRRELLESPGFERAHRGYPGKVERWTPPPPTPVDVYVDPDEIVDAEYGWGALAFGFHAPGGGPAWIELDFGGDSGPTMTTTRAWRDGGALAQIDDPSCDVRINEEAIEHVDFLSAERSRLVHVPTVLRDGGNRVLVALNFGARLRFSMRVLDVRGLPIASVSRIEGTVQLGAPVKARPPSTPIETALSWLENLENRSPGADALLGGAHLWLGEMAHGAALIEAALEREPSMTGARTWLAEYLTGESHAPQTWARGRARTLFESLVDADPANVRAVSALSSVLAAEDREDDALEMLRAAAAVAPTSPQQPLEISEVYAKLELGVPAERALLEALERAPQSPRAIQAVAQHWQGRGLLEHAAQLMERSLAEGASSVNDLQRAAYANALLGRVPRSIELRLEAAEMEGEEPLDDLAGYLQSLGRYEDAADVLARLAEQRPRSAYYHERLADVAHLRGDANAEIAHLNRVLEHLPGDRAARQRLAALGGTDPAEEFFERWSVDTAKELADFDATRWNEHVVRAIDAAAVYVFADGSWEQISHSRSIARDLEGCEALGSQSQREEMLRIATIKASTGEERQPVLVNGEYVMPALEPGDTVELIWRMSGEADREGRVSLGSWHFASQEEPFHLSRYVISIPKELPLELALRNFDGRYETIEEGERIVHVFELRDVERVVPEPFAAPPSWFLPWLEYGMKRSMESMSEQAQLDLVAALRPTPTVVEAARAAIEGVTGQEARARALHAFVGEALDKRNMGDGSASGALLQREGNPAIVYAALLGAVGIDCEIVRSRGMDPRGDPEPDPAFIDLDRWFGPMYVLVRPDDGEPAWCDLRVKTMPYGERLLDAPLAEAISLTSGEWMTMPDVPLENQPGQSTRLTIAPASDRSARVEVEFAFTGNSGFMAKESLREAPTAQLKQIATQVATQVVGGLDVSEHEWAGLATDGQLRCIARGSHKRYLDEQRDGFTCRLPFPAMRLGGLASGEGERTQPFLFAQTLVRSFSARYELPEDLKLVQGVEDVDLEYGGARFRQTLRPDGDRAFVIERSYLAPPLRFEPEEFAGFVAFCKQVDELDRAKLRFERVQ